MAIAIDCFARYGYQGTSIDRIARDAGVTKGALYYHFNDKEELLFEAVKDRIGEFEQRVAAATSTTARDALTRAPRGGDACFVHATKTNHRRFIITLMVEALDTNPRLSDEFRRIMRRFRTLPGRHRACVGSSRGRCAPTSTPEAAAAVIAGGVIGRRDPALPGSRARSICAAVLDTLVEQLADWLAHRDAQRGAKPAVSGGGKPWSTSNRPRSRSSSATRSRLRARGAATRSPRGRREERACPATSSSGAGSSASCRAASPRRSVASATTRSAVTGALVPRSSPTATSRSRSPAGAAARHGAARRAGTEEQHAALAAGVRGRRASPPARRPSWSRASTSTPTALATRAEREGGDYVLSGQKCFVPLGGRAPRRSCVYAGGAGRARGVPRRARRGRARASASARRTWA